MTWMKWIAATVAALGLATAAGAGTQAKGDLVVQKGIDGLRLGMTQKQVKAKAGPPRRVERGTNELGSFVVYRYRTYSVTFFAGDRVTQMDTRSPLVRTSAGIGVGSRESRVVADVKGAKCMTQIGVRHCYVGAWEQGKAITDFAIRNGRVVRISIGYLID